MRSRFVLLLMGVFVARMMECPLYRCGGSVGENAVCAVWSKEGMNMSTCNERDLTCRLPSGMEQEGFCVKKTSLPSLLPGEYCENSAQCLHGGRCEDSTCKGKKADESCKIDEECDVEMYCGSGKCKPANETDCGGDVKCVSNRLCYEGKCHLMGQLKDGADSEVPGLCKSYYVLDKKCAPGPRLTHGRECPKDGLCKYSDDSKQLCVCGKTPTGNKFCPPGKGEIDVSKVNLIMKIVFIVLKLRQEKEVPY